VRIAARLATAALVFLVYAPPHLASKVLFRRSRWPRRFLAAATRIVGVRVRLAGDIPGPHSLLLANHLSWLDIVILGGLGTSFVAKDNLGHGFLHWLADQNHTVYVRREHRKGARNQALEIAAALHRDQPVTIFPEGTTGPGTHLLPFRSTLIEAAGRRILVDCGLFQGDEELDRRNRLPFPYAPHELDGVLLTHAHLDHCGLLPRLVRAAGFRDVALEAVHLWAIYPDLEIAVTAQIETAMIDLYTQLAPRDRERLAQSLRRGLVRFREQDGVIRVPSLAWVVSGRK